ncbi:hypothetical protein FRUB_06263 [Fimbriiglobus ruber]|uniref:Uncharacterized protein n=1 Tax=Fimbriiglobus ruber TaxID=1908690 RepID=A0A225DCA9_9BACT|nr:hypothetical protein FRUB_06263 [Fimbriiglobus ruber]
MFDVLTPVVVDAPVVGLDDVIVGIALKELLPIDPVPRLLLPPSPLVVPPEVPDVPVVPVWADAVVPTATPITAAQPNRRSRRMT